MPNLRQWASRPIPDWLVGIALAGILFAGAWLRFRWPQWPLSDSDTWGYLNPALSQLTGHGFEHTYGRNFVYPGWVWLWLRLCGDFRAVTVAQHLLGLASGLVLWRCWENWRAWFPAWRLPTALVQAIGLGLVAFYLCSPGVIIYEHQIRPETIFPFFAILDVYLLLRFCADWWGVRRRGAGIFAGAAAIYVSALLYEIKPAFGLTVIFVCALPAFGWCFPPRGDATGRGARRLRLAIAAAAAVALVVLTLLLPERVLSRNDLGATLFLPETLFTIHSDIIRDQMRDDVAQPGSTRYPQAWLEETYRALDQDLADLSRPEAHPFRSFHFNPDRLLYGDNSFCDWLLRRDRDPARIASFCYYYYWRAWEHRPLPMLAKIGRQLALFYNVHSPIFWGGSKIRLRNSYQGTARALRYENYQRRLNEYPPARAYIAAATQLGETAPTSITWSWVRRLGVDGAVTFTPMLGLFVVGLSAAALGGRTSIPALQRLTPLVTPGLAVLGVYVYNFANCLTIAIVHTLRTNRYSHNQFVFCIFAQIAAATWLLELSCRLFGPRADASAARGAAQPESAPATASEPMPATLSRDRSYCGQALPA